MMPVLIFAYAIDPISVLTGTPYNDELARPYLVFKYSLYVILYGIFAFPLAVAFYYLPNDRKFDATQNHAVPMEYATMSEGSEELLEDDAYD